MENYSDKNKRIAKNTLMLYGRKLFSMFVSLYTSRVILETLGVVDFGVSAAVGTVIGMIGFLNDSMSGATSRFITYELGRGDFEQLKKVFSTSVMVHLVLALVVLLFLETFGLYILENELVIPEERMNAARVVYHVSVLSAVICIIQVPYNACLIAHEKFDIYAYVDILNVVLRLLIVFLLLAISFDKLILWSLLSFAVSLIIISIYRFYCVRNYAEARFSFVWVPDLLKRMLGFSGWDLYGNMSVIARTAGVNFLLNVFFGPVMNAAAGIASQVQGTVMSFAGNLVTAVRPQIVKRYATKDYDAMFELLSNGIKIAFVLLGVFSLPLMCEVDFVLLVWLGDVPYYTAIFCIYTLLFNFFANISLLLASVIHASGKIKRISFINGTLYLLVVPVSYIAYRLGASPVVAFLFNVMAVMIGALSNAWTIRLYIKEFSFKKFLFNDYLKCICLLLANYIIVYSLHYFMQEGWIRLFTSIVLSTLSLSISSFYILFPVSYRRKIMNFIRIKLCRKA